MLCGKEFFMKKTFCILTALMFFIGILGGCVNTDIKQTFDTADEMADYILENLSDFVKDYNRSQDTDSRFRADSCEKRFRVPLLHREDFVVCLDFDGDHGYMVVSKDNVLKIETKGNLEHLYAYEGTLYFSELDNEFAYDNAEKGYCLFDHIHIQD